MLKDIKYITKRRVLRWCEAYSLVLVTRTGLADLIIRTTWVWQVVVHRNNENNVEMNASLLDFFNPFFFEKKKKKTNGNGIIVFFKSFLLFIWRKKKGWKIRSLIDQIKNWDLKSKITKRIKSSEIFVLFCDKAM
jgi:hypothetical protein